jgi:hypothetical protein
MRTNLLLSVFLLGCLTHYSFAQVAINPTSRSFAKEGGGGSILTSGSGAWTGTTAAAWITITPKTTGNAGESCIYVVSANFSADSRQGVININTNKHTVNQTGYSSTISPSSTSCIYTGASGRISITVEAGVSWTAVANTNWVSVTPASGISAGSVSYTVVPYGGVTPRTASLTIAGKTFSITQSGLDVNIAPREVEMEYEADIVQVQVSALWNTSWSVVPGASWISVVDPGSGAGDSTVTLAVGTNPSYQRRTGTVQIGSASFAVSQKGTPYPVLNIIPPTATAESVGAYGNVAVLATPDAPWTAQSLDPWIVLASGATGAGNGNIQYVVSANPNLAERVGRIRVMPPVYQAESDLSWLLYSHVINGSADLSGWGRNMGGSLPAQFNGTFSYTLGGQAFYRKDDAFSIAFWFKIDNADTLNRLMQVNRASSSYSALYVDALNRLVFHSASEKCETSLLVEKNVEYQVVIATDTSRVVKVYAGKRGNSISEVGSKIFALTPFPTNYVTPDRIKIGAADLPSSGNLVGGTINDFRVYGRALSAYEAGRLFVLAGTASPYGGDRSYISHVGTVMAEFVFQGHGIDTGSGNFVIHSPGWLGGADYLVDKEILRLAAMSEKVQTLTGRGSSSNGDTWWHYTFKYSDGTTASTPERRASLYGPNDVTVVESNPYPSKNVAQITAYLRRSMTANAGSLITTAYGVAITSAEYGGGGFFQQNIAEPSSYTPDYNRFGLVAHALRGSASSSIIFKNHLAGSQSASATYNFWFKFDAFPATGSTLVWSRKVRFGKRRARSKVLPAFRSLCADREPRLGLRGGTDRFQS